MQELKKFGPMTEDHPSVGETCQACDEPFKAGDYTTLISIGPGNDPEEQKKAREGKPHTAVAVQVHYSCATGIITT